MIVAAFVIAVGPTWQIVTGFFGNLTAYAREIVPLSTSRLPVSSDSSVASSFARSRMIWPTFHSKRPRSAAAIPAHSLLARPACAAFTA